MGNREHQLPAHAALAVSGGNPDRNNMRLRWIVRRDEPRGNAARRFFFPSKEGDRPRSVALRDPLPPVGVGEL